METLTDQVIKGSFWGGLANFLNRIGAFIFTVFLARFLLPENFGLYSLTMSIALIFMTFADLGLNQTLIRYFSLYKNKKKAVAYFRYIFKIKFFLSLFLSFLLLITAYPLSHIFGNPSLFLPLVFASLFILTSLFLNFLTSFFYAIRKVKHVTIKEIIFQITRIFLTVFLFFILASSYYVLGVITALIITNMIILSLLIFWLYKFTPSIFRKTKERIEKEKKVKLIKFVGFITLTSISGIFFTYIDTIMLGFFVSFSYIGYYRAAFSFIFGIAGFFSYLSSVFLPIFTGLHKKRLERAFDKITKINSIISIPMTFGILALGKYFIKILYGNTYLPASMLLSLLSFLLITHVFSSMFSVLFYSKGNPEAVAKIIFISLLCNIFLNYFFISLLFEISELHALWGAALATVLSRFLLFFFFIKLGKEKLGIILKKKFFTKPILASIIMFFVLYFLNAYIVKDMTLLIGIGEIFLGVIVYFFFLILMKGLGKGEIELIQRVPIIQFLTK